MAGELFVVVAISWFDAWVGGVRHDLAILAVTPHTHVVEGHIPTRVGAVYRLEFDAEPSRIIDSSSPRLSKGRIDRIAPVRRLGGLYERGWIDGKLCS